MNWRLRLIDEVINPYFVNKRKELKLAPTRRALSGIYLKAK